jgi:hypothetical protein
VVDVAIDSSSPLNRHNVEVVLESVPPETTIAGGRRWRVRVLWSPGQASAPLFWPEVEAPGAAWTVTTSWTPGTQPTVSRTWAVAVSWSPGAAFDGAAASDALFLPSVWAFDSPLFLFPPGS